MSALGFGFAPGLTTKRDRGFSFGGTMPSGATLTRASAASYWTTAGLVATAAGDTPRFDCDPATGSLRGLLIEPAATNLVRGSATLDGSEWTGGNVTRAADAMIAPDGTASAEVITVTNASHSFRPAAVQPVTAGEQRVLSFWAKRGSAGDVAYMLLDFTNGVQFRTGGYMEQLPATGWARVQIPYLVPAGCSGVFPYLRAVAAEFVAIARDAGMAVRFQIGEPWWWQMPDGRPCLYDAAARAALGGAPVEVGDLAAPLGPAQLSLLDAAGALLAASTAALRDAVRVAAGGSAEVMLLVYLPTVLHGQGARLNLPTGWARPAYDVLQLEDYDWCAAGNVGASTRGVAAAQTRLNYPAEAQHYLAGFVARSADAALQWPAIAEGAARGVARGVAATFVWALPQVLRDGFVYWEGEDAVQAFDDVAFPLALGREVEVSPGFSTAVVTSAGGHESRNAGWAEARTRYDAGPGVRSEADIRALLAFFRARLGPARGFRLRDPFDSVSGSGDTPDAGNEPIGTGDGAATRFALVKHYGPSRRRITRPVAGSVRVAVGGVVTNAFTIEPGGWVSLDAAPPPGAAITAGFRFDVPVRFAEDRLSVNRATLLAGEATSVPLVEVREDG